MTPMLGKRWTIACGLAFVVALAATAPSVGDFGYTYDEPAYRHSQMLSAQWWQNVARGHFREMLEPDALLYFWDYGRHGINFHPPLAGQLNLLTYAAFGGVLKDIPARRMASVIEFALTVTLLFGFMSRRYGAWVGVVSAGSLLLMPRLFGQAHLIDTDTPGLLLWSAAACTFLRGLNDPGARWSRTMVGVLVGLAFVEKMAAVLVVLPIVGWMMFGPMIRSIRNRDGSTWRDGVLTSIAMLMPLTLAYGEVRRLRDEFLKLQVAHGVEVVKTTPARTDLFRDHPETWLPGAILLVPLVIWVVRAGVRRKRGVAVRPALDIWLSMLAFGPAIAWLGNPAWWREALPRLAHYYAITTARRGVLPDIQIIFFGQIFEFSLPWHNAWVLIAITVPASILIASVVGLLFAPWRDRLPVFFALNLAILPVMRMFPTPAHDGVRLFLPTFFFLAAFAGWGAIGLAEKLGRRWARPLLASLVLVPAAWGLIRVHPYELSYYNEFIGGPSGAWHRGFELSYWYDAFTDSTLDEINAKLPEGASVTFANVLSAPIMVLEDQQALGTLRGDVRVEVKESFPYMWLLTHDSKADAFSRLLFALHPWFESSPRQLDGLRVATVAAPIAASRAWALQLMLDRADRGKPEPPLAPEWVRANVPPLARLWGDGLTKARKLGVESTVIDWGRDDPEGLRKAAREVSATKGKSSSPEAMRLMTVLARYPDRAALLLKARPEALGEAVEIIIKKPDALRRVLLRQGYTDPKRIGGYLDE